MEIVITKCEVYLKKERLYDYEEFYNYLTHEIFLRKWSNKRRRNL